MKRLGTGMKARFQVNTFQEREEILRRKKEMEAQLKDISLKSALTHRPRKNGGSKEQDEFDEF